MRKLLGGMALAMLFTLNANAQETPKDPGLEKPISEAKCSKAFQISYNAYVEAGMDPSEAYEACLPAYNACMGRDE